MWSVIKSVFSGWREHEDRKLAAAVAFFTIFSLAPLLFLSVTIGGYVFGEEAASGELFAHLTKVMGRNTATLLENLFEQAAKSRTSGLTSSLSLALLLYAASGVFAELQDALNHVWEVPDRRRSGILNFLVARLVAACMVIATGILLIASLSFAAVLKVMERLFQVDLPWGNAVWHGLNSLALFLFLLIMIELIYRFLPAVRMPAEAISRGAFASALLIALGHFAVGLYLSRRNVSGEYGAAASLVVLLVWLYYSVACLLIGAEIVRALKAVKARKK